MEHPTQYNGISRMINLLFAPSDGNPGNPENFFLPPPSLVFRARYSDDERGGGIYGAFLKYEKDEIPPLNDAPRSTVVDSW